MGQCEDCGWPFVGSPGASDQPFRDGVSEDVAHSYYKGGKLHPWKGETEPNFTDFQPDGKYSWVKSPRFQNKVYQVGPLAQVLVGYSQGHPLTRKYAGQMLDTVNKIGGHHAGPEALHSTLGRHAARAIRAAMLADLAQKHWQLLAAPMYATGSHQWNGVVHFNYAWYPRQNFRLIEAGINGSRFSTMSATDSSGHAICGGFYKIAPYFRLFFPRSSPASLPKREKLASRC